MYVGPMRTCLRIAVTLAVMGCTPVLTEAGSKVLVLKTEPPPACRAIGPVEWAGYRSGRLNRVARFNRAAELGATHIRYLPREPGDDSDIVVMAYQCPHG